MILCAANYFLTLISCSDDPHPEVTPIGWSESIDYSVIFDQRDGKSYRATRIGDRKWMAENLNYSGAGKCYQDENAYCAVYGRLYTWYDLGIDSTNVKGICPSGWHVPSNNEWMQLLRDATSDPGVVAKAIQIADSVDIINDYYSHDSLSAVILKSANGWGDKYVAMDYYGFRILPYNPDTPEFKNASFWSSTSDGIRWAGMWWLYRDETYIGYSNPLKSTYRTLRCINDTVFSD